MSQIALTFQPAARTARRWSLPLMVGTFILLWSSAFSVGKIAIADCPPLLFLTARFLLAGVVMMALAAMAGARWTLTTRDVLLFAALGVANQAMYLGIGFIGLESVSAGLSALIVSANPIVTGRIRFVAAR